MSPLIFYQSKDAKEQIGASDASKKWLEMDQQFSLSWNNFHGNLSKGFASLLGNGEFVDVTIAVDGHLLQAHKVILSICSPYFKKMFQLNPCQHPIGKWLLYWLL